MISESVADIAPEQAADIVGIRNVVHLQRRRPPPLAHQPVEFGHHVEGPEVALGRIESASRAWAAITARMRIGRPSKSWSETKSMLQISFGAAAPGCPIR